MIDSIRIKNRIREKGLQQKEIAAEMGISQSSFNQKINKVRGLSLDEAHRLSEILEISQADFGTYFFA